MEESQRFCLELALKQQKWEMEEKWERGLTCWLRRGEGQRRGLDEGRRRDLQGLQYKSQ